MSTHLHMTPEHIEAIMCGLVSGETLPELVKKTGIPLKVFWRFLESNAEAKAAYEFALRCQVQTWMQECIEIADDRNRKGDDKRIQIETRMKLAAKYHPALFGEVPKGPTVQMNFGTLSNADLQRRIAELMRPAGVVIENDADDARH